MYVLLEVLKGIFFFLSLVVGLFFLRGDTIINADYYNIIKQILMPGYLLFCGIMIGYIISRIWLGYDDEKYEKTAVYTKSFMIGTTIGVILAIIYIVL